MAGQYLGRRIKAEDPVLKRDDQPIRTPQAKAADLPRQGPLACRSTRQRTQVRAKTVQDPPFNIYPPQDTACSIPDRAFATGGAGVM